MMNYIVRSYDRNTGSISVEFEGCGVWNIDLPITDGKYPEGEELEHCIQSFAPVHIIERKNALEAGVINETVIQAIVEPIVVAEADQAAVDAAAAQEALQVAKLTALINNILDERAKGTV